MSDKDLILNAQSCRGSFSKIKGIVFLPVREEPEKIDPVTEDAEFEVLDPKVLPSIDE